MTALIGALRVSLSADTAQFEQGMKRAQRTTSASATAISRSAGIIKGAVAGFVSGLSVGLFVNAIKGSLDYAASLAEVAQQVGSTARDLQVLRFAAGQVGVDTEVLETGLSKLTITMGKLAAGAEAPRKALEAVKKGLADQVQNAGSSGEAFRILADGLATVTNRAQRAAVEVAVFGKSGSQLDNLLSGGSDQINELSAAAEKLGLVLSDEQIRNADATADKLAALKTVLAANIAGVVADNAGAILSLAQALASLVGLIGHAISGWSNMTAQLRAGLPFLAQGIGGIGAFMQATDSVAAKQVGDARRDALGARFASTVRRNRIAPAGTNIGKFLASGGGGGGGHHAAGGGGASHVAEDLQRQQEDALRDAKDFADQQRRAEMDIIGAKRDLADDYHERNHFSIQMLDLEHEENAAELAYQVALNKLTKGKEGLTQAQADQLAIAYDTKDGLERQKIAVDDAAEQSKRLADLKDHEFDRQRDLLESADAIATTQAERRKIELEILRIAYEQKRQALQHILDTSRDANELQDASRDLASLNATYGNSRQNVMQQTRGPLEEWAATVPHTADQINEALQSIEVEGLDGLTDAIMGIIDGTKSMKSAFHDLAASILADLIKMSIKMAIFRALSALGGAFGGSSSTLSTGTFSGGAGANPGWSFATGGAFTVMGNSGVDKNVMSLNGLPIANVSRGERVHIANDDMPTHGGATVHQHFDLRGAVMTEDLLRQVNARADQAAETGARMGVDRMVDLNRRTFGKALR